MLSLISHISLGLLLGALCGLGMSPYYRGVNALMRSVAGLSGLVFMITALAAKLYSPAPHSVELLADAVMGGVAASLLLTTLSIYARRFQRRNQLKARA